MFAFWYIVCYIMRSTLHKVKQIMRTFFITVFSAVFALAAYSGDYGILVKNYNRLYVPDKANVKEADQILADQNPDGSFKSVAYSDKSRGAWKGMKHWSKLRTLVGTWNSTGKKQYRDAVIAGLHYWGRALPKNSNWWWQEIGVPRLAIRVINNMKGGVPTETLEIIRPLFDRAKLGMTGQNLADAAVIHFWKGLYYNDKKMVCDAVDAFGSVVKVAAYGKEGLQSDMSFHQHGPQQQFGNYGLGFFENTVTFMRMLAGSSYSMSETEKQLVYDYFFNGLRWTLFKKQMDYLACGRQIPKRAPYGKYEKTAKNARYFDDTNQAKKRVNEFFRNDSVLEGSNYFFRSDYLVHRRKDFYFSYKMSSKRVVGGEMINKENLKGLYLGCGVMQYKISGTEYDNMPALWDWRRLPGLTAIYDNCSLSERRSQLNTSAAVGAVCDGIDSCVVMDFNSKKFSYKKSIVAVDKAVIFNVSDIKGNGKAPMNTTVDSRLYSGPAEIESVNGKKVFEDGIHQLEKVSRIIHGGIAYTFLKPRDVTLVIEEKSCPWKDICVDSKGVQKGKVFTVYVDHGKEYRPEDTLSCIITPSADTKKYSSFFTGCGHVVKNESGSFVFAGFFAPGKMEIPGVGTISSDKKAAVMLKDKTISVADVQQENKNLTVTLNGKSYTFELPQGVYSGKSVTLSK